MFKIFIGYDERETVAYHVCAHSILSRATVPVAIIPLNKKNLGSIYRRPVDENASTDFAFSRFLVPYLSGYQGISLFMDCDMIVRCDIAKILLDRRFGAHVNVVKHDYTPKSEYKFLGAKQHKYPCKNWSSVMLFNNAMCHALNPDTVAERSGAWLHQFHWTEPDNIGSLDPEWNHLVGEYEPNPNAKIVHFTLGTPCFNDYSDQEFADEWRAERAAMLYAKN